MPSSLIQKIRNQVSTPIGHALIRPRLDDAYIAAYPRSGSTWLRTILVNILVPGANSDPDVFNAIIPAVSIRNAKPINGLVSPRIIMTHSIWRGSINKAIYLVRDGRDAFISSYHYHVTRNKLEMNIEEYFQLYTTNYYGHTWSRHVESWLGEGSVELGSNLLVVRFEELKNDPIATVVSVLKFLGKEIDINLVSIAVEGASLDAARKIEQKRQGPLGNANQSFYRAGHTGQWQNEAYSEVIQKFELSAKMAIDLAGYRLGSRVSNDLAK